jgi:hypothetical protein
MLVERRNIRPAGNAQCGMLWQTHSGIRIVSLTEVHLTCAKSAHADSIFYETYWLAYDTS